MSNSFIIFYLLSVICCTIAQLSVSRFDHKNVTLGKLMFISFFSLIPIVNAALTVIIALCFVTLAFLHIYDKPDKILSRVVIRWDNSVK